MLVWPCPSMSHLTVQQSYLLCWELLPDRNRKSMGLWYWELTSHPDPVVLPVGTLHSLEWFWVSRRIFIYSHHNTIVFLPEASFGLRVLWLPVSVCVYQSLACPQYNSSPVQARITKFGPEKQNTLVKIPIAVLWISPNSWVAHRTTHGGKLGRPNHCLVARIILTYLLKTIFLVINTKFACFLFDQVPTYRELGRPSGDSGGHVGSPDRVMGHIWRLGDLLSAALLLFWGQLTLTFKVKFNFKVKIDSILSLSKLLLTTYSS